MFWILENGLMRNFPKMNTNSITIFSTVNHSKDKIWIFNLMMLLMENWPLLSRVRFQKLGFSEEFGDRPIPIITWKGKKTTWKSIRDWWLQWVARSWRDIAPNIQLSCPNFTFSTIFDDPRDRRGINSIFLMKQLKSWSCVFLLFI